MYCPKCGKENENDNKFCDKCGANLQEEQIVQKEEKTNPQKQSKLKLAIPIVLVVCVGLAVLLFGSGDKYVKEVREGYFVDYPNATVGAVVENLIPNAEWTSEVTEDYQVVVVTGNSNEDTYEIHFMVDAENESFEILMVIKNGEACSVWEQRVEIENWYVDYAKANPDAEFHSDFAASFLSMSLEELYEFFANDYESLGYLYGSLLISFTEDNCPYIFCMESMYDSEYYEYLTYDSAVEGVIVRDAETLINEEVKVGMTYDELMNNAERGITGVLEWNDMKEAWCAYVYYDGYNVCFEFLEEVGPSYMALVTLTE